MDKRKILEAPISHEMEPHCCGCWVIWVDGDELYAQCNECLERRDILEFLATPDCAAASAKAVEQTHAELDLAMMLRRMIWQINKMDGDSSLKGLAIGAMQLLKKYQLEGSPLRAAAASEQRGGSDG